MPLPTFKSLPSLPDSAAEIFSMPKLTPFWLCTHHGFAPIRKLGQVCGGDVIHWVTMVTFQLQLLILWNWNETIMIITKLNTLSVLHMYLVLPAVLKCNPLKSQGLVVQSRIKKNSGFARNSILSWTLTNIVLKILLPTSWCLETE